ncbi:MAG: energy transducer TonB [Gemmatimonadaceae bacterium]
MLRFAGVLVLLPTLLTAQRREPACVPPHTPDSLTVAVTAKLTPFDTSQALPAPFVGLLLQEIGTRLEIPQPFVLSTYIAPDTLDGRENKPRRAYAGVYAMFAITVHRGTIKPLLASSTGVPAFDTALLKAISSVGADSAVPPLPESLRNEQVELRLRIYTSPQLEKGEETLFRLRVPVAMLSHDVKPLRPRSPLHYPDELRRVNMQGSVLTQYVVDEAGLPLEGSLRIVSATHALFAQAVIEFIPKARFEPARIGGCPVAVTVQQPFNFVLVR